MPVRVRCPTCGQTVEVSDSLADKVVRCAVCGELLRIRESAGLTSSSKPEPKPPQEEYVIRNEGEDLGPSLWRNPAVYIAFAAIAALVVALIIVVTPRNPAAPQQAAPSVKSSLSEKVAEEPGKAARQDGAATPAKTATIVDKVVPAAPTPKLLSDEEMMALPSGVPQPKPRAGGPTDDLDAILALPSGTQPKQPPAAPVPVAQPAALTPEALFAKAAPAVVKITALTGKGERVGTGFYVSEDGLIVTNYHVLEGATWVSVFMSVGGPGKEIPLGVILAKNAVWKGFPPVPGFCDPEADLAVFRNSADAPGRKTPHLELAAVTSKPNIGARVYTIGNPHELDKTLSDGLISGFREWENGLTVIQTTVPISGGSSGGPLMDASGCVVGVIFASEKGGQNLNYAVPLAKVRALVERAKAGIAKGETGNLEQELLKSGRGGEEIARARAAISEKDFAGALRILQGLKDSDPQNAEVWYLLAKTQFELLFPRRSVSAVRNYEQIIDSANMAIALKPDYFEAYQTLSSAAAMAQRYDLWLNAANAMVRLRPAEGDGYHMLGGALSSLGRHREAASAYETALKLASDDQSRATHLISLGEEYESLGRIQEAIGCMERALTFERQKDDITNVLAYCVLIRCYLATGNELAAQRNYNALKKLSPKSAAEISPPIAPGRR